MSKYKEKLYHISNHNKSFLNSVQVIVVPYSGFHPGFFNWGGGGPATLVSQIHYLITTLDHLELGVVDEGLYFLQCRKLLKRVVEYLPNRHQCCKDFLQTWQTSPAEMQQS